MKDPDTPTVPASEAGSRPPTVIEALLTSYVLAVESGVTPMLQHFLSQLETREQREQFVDLIDQLAFADQNLPLRLRARLVIGGRYELLESIGSGGMGQVWRALDRKLGHEVAVKVLSLAATAAIDLDHLVEREGKLLAKLSHPGIVRIQDTGRDGEHRFLIMDLIAGASLDDLIEQMRERREQRKESIGGRDLLQITGPAKAGRTALLQGNETWTQAVTKIVIDLLRTLEAAHGTGVIHRDLKPANVRLTGGACPVLLDFGISLSAGMAPGQMTAAMFGTAQYSAPEQWDNTRLPGVPTDIYQMGLVLYELLTLHRCFASTSPIETMRAVRGGTYQRPRQIDGSLDAGLEACVLRAMEVEPARRYQSAAEFRADLERSLAGEIPRAAAGLAMVSQRLRALGRRNRRWLSLAAAGLVGAIGLWVLQPAAGPGVTWITATAASVQLDKPSLMVAFRFATDAGGTCYCAPLRIDSGTDRPVGQDGKRLSFAHSLPAGTTEVSLQDVADATQFPDSMISTVLVDAADASGRRKFDGFVDAMDLARREIEKRGGDWLSEAEFRGFLQGGRGAAPVEVPVDSLFKAGAWQANGLMGRVIAPVETR